MADLEGIHNTLTSVDTKLDDLLQWKAAMDERCESHREQTKEVREILFGNPGSDKSGLKTNVERLMNYKKNISRWRDFWMYILKVVLATAILSVAGWLLLIYKGS